MPRSGDYLRGHIQVEFTVLLDIPNITTSCGKNGTRKPSEAALRLLAVAKHHPEALEAA